MFLMTASFLPPHRRSQGEEYGPSHAYRNSRFHHRLESEAQDQPLHLTHPSEHPVERHLGFVPTGQVPIHYILSPGITDDFSLIACIGIGGDWFVGFEVQVQDSEITTLNTLAGSTGGLGE